VLVTTRHLAAVAWISTEDDESFGVLYLMASAEGPIVWTGQNFEEFRDLGSPSRKITEAVAGLTRKEVGKWELLADGWYADLS
jgi:hypothetical protein